MRTLFCVIMTLWSSRNDSCAGGNQETAISIRKEMALTRIIRCKPIFELYSSLFSYIPTSVLYGGARKHTAPCFSLIVSVLVCTFTDNYRHIAWFQVLYSCLAIVQRLWFKSKSHSDFATIDQQMTSCSMGLQLQLNVK
jgi:hypothetical protein